MSFVLFEYFLKNLFSIKNYCLIYYLKDNGMWLLPKVLKSLLLHSLHSSNRRRSLFPWIWYPLVLHIVYRQAQGLSIARVTIISLISTYVTFYADFKNVFVLFVWPIVLLIRPHNHFGKALFKGTYLCNRFFNFKLKRFSESAIKFI